jgi:hypothetical protein
MCPLLRSNTVSRSHRWRPLLRKIPLGRARDTRHQVGSQADSAGSIPVTRSKREQRCRTSKFDCLSQAGQRSFASENGTRAITRAISHLGECPWRLSVPKLTVRVRFPSPAPHSKSVAAEANWKISVLCLCVFPVHAQATLGHTYPHLGAHPSGSEDAQLVPLCSPAVRSPVHATAPKSCPRHNLRSMQADSTTKPRRSSTSDPRHAPAR